MSQKSPSEDRRKRSLASWRWWSGLGLAVWIWAACSSSTSLAEEKEVDTVEKQLGELVHAKRFDEALPLARRAVMLRETEREADEPDYVDSLDNLAGILYRLGKQDEALPLLEKALEISVNKLGSQDNRSKKCVNDLVAVQIATITPLLKSGRFQDIATIMEEWVRFDDSLPTLDDDPRLFHVKGLAEMYNATRDFTKGVAMYERWRSLLEKNYGPDASENEQCLNSFATLYRKMRDYTKAEALLLRALEIERKTHENAGSGGKTRDDSYGTMFGLSELYVEKGDYDKAEQYLQSILSSQELSPFIRAQTLCVLAEAYDRTGKREQLAEILEMTLKIENDSFAANPKYYSPRLEKLGVFYQHLGKYAKAEELMKRSQAGDERLYTKDHFRVAASLDKMGALYEEQGKFAEAEAVFGQALDIRTRTLGPDHGTTANTLAAFSLLMSEEGKSAEALDLAVREIAAKEAQMANVFSFASEQERLDFARGENPCSILATLGSAPALAEALLRTKGLVLDSVLEDRIVLAAVNNPATRDLILKAESAKRELSQLLFTLPKDTSPVGLKARERQRVEFSEKFDSLEAEVARSVPNFGKVRRGLRVTVAQVQQALPENAALVEMLRYTHFLGKGQHEERYGTLIVPSKGEVKWVSLGNAALLDKKVRLYQKSVRGKTDADTLRAVLTDLGALVWDPVAGKLPEGTQQVVLCPDGELNFLSFATLLAADGRFLSERYEFDYVASGRDLLRGNADASGDRMTIFGDADFQSAAGYPPGQLDAASLSLALREVECRDFGALTLPALPGTGREAEALRAHAAEWRWRGECFTGPAASENALKAVVSPHVLHLATHGFFLPEGDGVAARKNPMHRSGLALSGAQNTLAAWARGETPPMENDGIITAEEVGGLHLENTWLVTLSACDTGSGEARAGEGVMGLRRGFLQAGTQNLLMTLWPVPDKETATFMLDFYTAAHSTGSVSRALAQTQRAWLTRLRGEGDLLSAVRAAGPFIVTFQGTLR